ncbi:MAG: family 43 glycosylhydrolase [Fimbriimonadaceae bacterium]|nr:family 43 glycosylhydrolase [Fimbriimonadaceae bacterium]
MLGLSLATVGESPGTYRNPVWERDFPDPFLVRDGRDFYAYATHNGPEGFQLMTSRDLVRWTHLGGIGKPDWSDGQLWAPEVVHWRGKWYLFFSARDRETGKRDLAVSVGESPRGPFRPHAKLVTGRSENPGDDDNGAIDPDVFIDNGRPYLLYVRESPPRAIKIVSLGSDMRRTEGEARTILLADRPEEKGILDAPTLVRRGRTYWLFYSSGWFQSSKEDACYRVWAARSSRLFGPYAKPVAPLLETRPGETYSPGHQAVLELPSGEWWIAYHGWNTEGDPMYGHNPVGRTLRLDRLAWTKGGPRTPGPTLSAQPLPRIEWQGSAHGERAPGARSAAR